MAMSRMPDPPRPSRQFNSNQVYHASNRCNYRARISPSSHATISASSSASAQYIYLYIYIYTHTHTHTHIYIYIYIYIYLSIYIYIGTHTHTYTYKTNTYIYVYIYVYMWRGTPCWARPHGPSASPAARSPSSAPRTMITTIPYQVLLCTYQLLL